VPERPSREAHTRGTVAFQEGKGQVSPGEATEGDRIETRVPRADVLAWAAMDLADVPDLDPAPFDVRGLIDGVAQRFVSPAREKGLEMEVKTAASVPSLALGEVEWLREVLSGLMDNAVRFTDSGEVVASITADRTGGSRVLFHAEVSDTGRGMSEDALDRLFGPRQGGGRQLLPLPDAEQAGTLEVAQRLVELMDGRLGCSSALGMGTTTWFTVPLDVVDGQG
jgi:signal transduction histidine kinase